MHSMAQFGLKTYTGLADYHSYKFIVGTRAFEVCDNQGTLWSFIGLRE